MECKGTPPRIFSVLSGHDLIDTLWNVKEHAFRYGIGSLDDLIDTLWNVKAGQKTQRETVPGRFNRYIVECKAGREIGKQPVCTGFNRYIVECKVAPSSSRIAA